MGRPNTAWRSRAAVALALLVVLALGVLFRLLLGPSLGVVGSAIGDVCYALAIYLVLVWIANGVPARTAAILTLILCWAIEFAQLTGLTDAIAGDSRLIRTVLGTTFSALDLVLYAVGVLVAVLLDRLWLDRRAGMSTGESPA